MASNELTNSKLNLIQEWFKQRNWQPFQFQKDCWQAYLNGESGLLNAPTGSGKTYALWIPCLLEYINNHPTDWKDYRKNGLQVLWITPLRALTKDIHKAMEAICYELEIPWRIAYRTGDTSTTERQKQKKNAPECLITTPESLHLMLAQKNYPDFFKNLKAVIVDEWHELLGSKRGVQVELGLSRLRAIKPDLKTWGISATIGNLKQAASVVAGNEATIIRTGIKKKIEVVSILPDKVEKFPWAGHLGINLIDKIIPILEESSSTLIFTNTRAQTEIWYQKLMEKAPQFAGLAAMHHGSLDKEIREWVENAIHENKLKVVVCTSSLDLGVDFRPVDTVIQIGGPKGVGRFMQRAGRSGHRPDATSKIYFLPTHSLELVEGAALRQAVREVSELDDISHMESRNPIYKPLDVLIQYLVTLAVSDGFLPDEIFKEVRKTFAYKGISKEEWEWCLQFITSGGESLGAYEEFNKVQIENDVFKVLSRKTAMRHRMSMGTIVGEPVVKIKYSSGGYVGTVEEYFIARLKPGDVFWFSGKALEFVKIDKMTAFVKRSKRKTAQVPRWMGARLPLSSELSQLIRDKLDNHIISDDVELKKIYPLLDLQESWSVIPKKNEFLIESVQSKEGYHLFVYPFEGRMVHEIMAALISYRISQITPITFSFAMNDYGFELLADTEIPLEHALELDLFSTENLLFDIEQSINEAEMAKRRFREIAVISGLIFQGYPGKNKASRHLQASSELLFNVFSEYDSDNLLIKQAFNEVVDLQLEKGRLIKVLDKIKHQKIVIKKPPRFTPFSFPIVVDRLREKISSESVEERIAKMQLRLEEYAGSING
ncbi:ligase-associated DNA damage response DEXH box helicase [Chondrinema litorale]|uniref:ligase-associated DNA damage response DEXH box helicase n=1 Tax=Chondrinema litorale TaxID=2994555 RepID=UPI002544B491|nr:ligase-associated DNA damage response DEXH box helicase [Chondrinema litorale]UZR94564.1 ligase-associated DNA damage response DEXH box helicase [Chondrinema litorale]